MDPMLILLLINLLMPSLEGLFYFNKNLDFIKIALSIAKTPV